VSRQGLVAAGPARRGGAGGCFSGAVEKAEFPKEEAARYEIAKLLDKAAENGGLPPASHTARRHFSTSLPSAL